MQKVNQEVQVASKISDEAKPEASIEELQAQIACLNEIINNLGFLGEDHAKMALKGSHVEKVKKAEMAKLQEIFNKDAAKITAMLEQGKIDKSKAVELATSLEAAFEKKSAEITQYLDQHASEIGQNINTMVLNDYKAKNPAFAEDPFHDAAAKYILESYGAISPKDLDFIADVMAKIRQEMSSSVQPEKDVEKTNKQDISKLVSAVDTPSSQYQVGAKTFTRADIAKMSPAEYKKYEKAIFEQIKKGLVK